MANKLLNDFNLNCDTAIMSQQLYLSMQHDLENFVRKSSHAQRFKLLNTAQDDVHFCLQFNTAPTLPIMQGEYIFNTTISTV